MHFFLLFILFLLSSSSLDCKPSRQVAANERSNREVEYEGENEATAEDYAHDEQEGQQMGSDRGEVRYDQPSQREDSYLKSDEEKLHTRTHLEANKFADYKTGREINEESEPNVNLEENVAIPSDGQHINTYRETYETDNNQPTKVLSLETQSRQRVQNEEAYPKQRDMSYHAITNDEGEMLFKNKPNQNENESYRYEYPNIEGRRRFKSEYNAMDMNNKRIRENKRYDIGHDVERDRRQVKQAAVLSNMPNEKDLNVAIEDSETIIKNRIKKLSKEELEDLLNSLTDDKKSALKKVIDSKDAPNKREITKKAGASEENSLLENSLIDTKNLQGESSSKSNIDLVVSESEDSTGSGLSNENNDSTNTKLPETEKSSEKSNTISQLAETNLNEKPEIESIDSHVNLKNEDKLSDNSKDSAKNENKRETSLRQLPNKELLRDEDEHRTDYQEPLLQSSVYDINENYSDMENDELHADIKRENPIKSGNSLQSLQDSFPTLNEEHNFKSDLAPLIRVKRTERENLNKKRDANASANIKVPFFPDVENENLENDERSEFEDYGIFDRESHNGAEQFEVSGKMDSLCRQRRLKSNKGYSTKDKSKTRNINPDVDNMSLGSDTDSVLTGVEGVDQNIMYNSGLRNKRAVENPKIIAENIKVRVSRTTGPLELNPLLENNKINSHTLKEDEAFGSLSRNYEGDITRYKRIREVN